MDILLVGYGRMGKAIEKRLYEEDIVLQGFSMLMVNALPSNSNCRKLMSVSNLQLPKQPIKTA